MAERPKALQEAIDAAGGVGKLGAKIGISGEAISQWEVVPAGRVIPIESVTGIPREKLRPDLYPPRSGAAA